MGHGLTGDEMVGKGSGIGGHIFGRPVRMCPGCSIYAVIFHDQFGGDLGLIPEPPAAHCLKKARQHRHYPKTILTSACALNPIPCPKTILTRACASTTGGPLAPAPCPPPARGNTTPQKQCDAEGVRTLETV